MLCLAGVRCANSPWGKCPVCLDLISSKEISRELQKFPVVVSKAVFKLLGQIFDVIRWPVFDVHAKVQPHA